MDDAISKPKLQKKPGGSTHVRDCLMLLRSRPDMVHIQTLAVPGKIKAIRDAIFVNQNLRFRFIELRQSMSLRSSEIGLMLSSSQEPWSKLQFATKSKPYSVQVPHEYRWV